MGARGHRNAATERKHATWLDQPHFATLLYTYAPRPTERDYRPTHALGLSPSAERALRRDAALEASHRKWLELAKDAEVVPTRPLPPARTARSLSYFRK
jgi:hypothetical protein